MMRRQGVEELWEQWEKFYFVAARRPSVSSLAMVFEKEKGNEQSGHKERKHHDVV